MLRKQAKEPEVNLTTLAGRLGVSLSYLSQVMNGRRTPSVRLARKIADELGWGIGQVLALSGHGDGDESWGGPHE